MKLRLLSLLLSALLLTGCGRDMSDLEAYVQEVLARPAQPIPPLPHIKPYEVFTYAANDRADPFLAVKQVITTPRVAASLVSPDFDRPKEVLESMPLDSLRMLGVIGKNKNLWALVQSPDGVVHKVKKGNYLGTNHGRVTAIHPDELELQEVVNDGFGGYKREPAVLGRSE